MILVKINLEQEKSPTSRHIKFELNTHTANPDSGTPLHTWASKPGRHVHGATRGMPLCIGWEPNHILLDYTTLQAICTGRGISYVCA